MVLCLDVFEANWLQIASVVKLCDDAMKSAETQYKKVSMVLCV